MKTKVYFSLKLSRQSTGRQGKEQGKVAPDRVRTVRLAGTAANREPTIALRVFHGCQGVFLVRIDEISPDQSAWGPATLHAGCAGMVSLGVRDLSPQDINAPE